MRGLLASRVLGRPKAKNHHRSRKVCADGSATRRGTSITTKVTTSIGRLAVARTEGSAVGARTHGALGDGRRMDPTSDEVGTVIVAAPGTTPTSVPTLVANGAASTVAGAPVATAKGGAPYRSTGRPVSYRASSPGTDPATSIIAVASTTDGTARRVLASVGTAPGRGTTSVAVRRNEVEAPVSRTGHEARPPTQEGGTGIAARPSSAPGPIEGSHGAIVGPRPTSRLATTATGRDAVGHEGPVQAPRMGPTGASSEVTRTGSPIDPVTARPVGAITPGSGAPKASAPIGNGAARACHAGRAPTAIIEARRHAKGYRGISLGPGEEGVTMYAIHGSSAVDAVCFLALLKRSNTKGISALCLRGN